MDREKREVIHLKRPEWMEYIKLSHSRKVPPIFWHGLFLIYEWSIVGKYVYEVIEGELKSMSNKIRKIAIGELKANISTRIYREICYQDRRDKGSAK